MKLFFTKDSQGEIKLEIQRGTDRIEFDYVEMVRQLMENNEIETPDYENLEPKEKEKIQSLLSEIRQAVEDGKCNMIDNL